MTEAIAGFVTGSDVPLLVFGVSAVAGTLAAAIQYRARRSQLKSDRTAAPSRRPKRGEALLSWVASVLVLTFLFRLNGIAVPSWALVWFAASLALALVRELLLYRRHRNGIPASPVESDERFPRAILGLLAMSAIGAVGNLVLSAAHGNASAPASAWPIAVCPAGTRVPAEGNEVNAGVAGTTAQMTVGSKIYVMDSQGGARRRGR